MFGTAIYNTNLYNSIDITLCISVFLFAMLSDYLKDRIADTYASKLFFWIYILSLFDALSLIGYSCSMFFLSPDSIVSIIMSRVYTIADSLFFLTYTMYAISNTYKERFTDKKFSRLFTLGFLATEIIFVGISLLLPIKMYNQTETKMIYATSGPAVILTAYPWVALLLIVCIIVLFKEYKKFSKEQKLSFVLTFVGLIFGFVASLIFENETIITTAICEYMVLITYLTTERKSIKLIGEVNAEKDRYNESNKLQEQFFSIISHDMRNPLNVIVGNSEYILNSDLSKEQIKETAGDMEEAAYELKEFISNILNISKISTGKYELASVEYSIIDVIRDITDRLSREIESKKIKFKIDVNPEMYYSFRSDANKVKTIIQLIIKNIIHNDNDNVSIKFDTKTSEDNKTDLIININHTGSSFTKEQFNIEINDYIDLLAQNSETLKNDFLGVIIAREYIKMLNGTISYETNMNSWIDIKIPQELVSNETIKETKMYQDSLKGGDK